MNENEVRPRGGWLRGRVRDSRKGPWSGRHGTERTGATLR